MRRERCRCRYRGQFWCGGRHRCCAGGGTPPPRARAMCPGPPGGGGRRWPRLARRSGCAGHTRRRVRRSRWFRPRCGRRRCIPVLPAPTSRSSAIGGQGARRNDGSSMSPEIQRSKEFQRSRELACSKSGASSTAGFPPGHGNESTASPASRTRPSVDRKSGAVSLVTCRCWKNAAFDAVRIDATPS